MTTKTDTPATTAAKTLYAARNFKDSGSERQFAKGDKLTGEVEDGELGNYVAAGLTTDKKLKADEA